MYLELEELVKVFFFLMAPLFHKSNKFCDIAFQWAKLHLFLSVTHILFACWCDKSICFMTLSRVLWLYIIYLLALWRAADAAVATFIFAEKKGKSVYFLMLTNVRKQKSKHESFSVKHVCLSVVLTAVSVLIQYLHNGKVKETAE